jgi:hypothetical protein
MPKKLTPEENLRRAAALLDEVEALLSQEPALSSLHGGWIVRIVPCFIDKYDMGLDRAD